MENECVYQGLCQANVLVHDLNTSTTTRWIGIIFYSFLFSEDKSWKKSWWPTTCYLRNSHFDKGRLGLSDWKCRNSIMFDTKTQFLSKHCTSPQWIRNRTIEMWLKTWLTFGIIQGGLQKSCMNYLRSRTIFMHNPCVPLPGSSVFTVPCLAYPLSFQTISNSPLWLCLQTTQPELSIWCIYFQSCPHTSQPSCKPSLPSFSHTLPRALPAPSSSRFIALDGWPQLFNLIHLYCRNQIMMHYCPSLLLYRYAYPKFFSLFWNSTSGFSFMRLSVYKVFGFLSETCRI